MERIRTDASSSAELTLVSTISLGALEASKDKVWFRKTPCSSSSAVEIPELSRSTMISQTDREDENDDRGPDGDSVVDTILPAIAAVERSVFRCGGKCGALLAAGMSPM